MEQGKERQPDAGDWFAKSDAGIKKVPSWWPTHCEACLAPSTDVVLILGLNFMCKVCHHEWISKELKEAQNQPVMNTKFGKVEAVLIHGTCEKCQKACFLNSGPCVEFGMECPKVELELSTETDPGLLSTAGEPTAPDLVNHPPHYTSHPSGVECITVTEHMGFNLGNAVKYIWRADEKGTAVQDLEKAAWYVNREIAKRKKEQGK